MATKRPRGRPRLKNPATEQIHLRVTKERKARYKKAAGKPGVSAWLIDLADKASG